ncbi:unnamed protein product, partial [Ectocarpus sp. 12 AP-2014]
LPPPDPNELKPPTPDQHDDDTLEPEGDESGGPDSDTLLSSSLPSRASSTGKENQQDASANSPRRSPTGGGIRGRRQHHRGAGESGQGTSQGTGDSGSKADRLAASISQALKDAGLNE